MNKYEIKALTRSSHDIEFTRVDYHGWLEWILKYSKLKKKRNEEKKNET